MAGLTLADLWRETRAVVARHRNVLLTLGAATVFLPNAALRLLAPDMAGPGFDPTKPVVVPPGFWLLMVTVIMLQLVGVFAIGAITADSHEGGGRTLGRILGDAVPSLGRFLLALIVFFGVYFVGSIIFGLVLAIFVSAGVPLGISGGPGTGPAPMAFAALILAIFIPLGVWLWARLVPLVGVYLREPVGVIAGIRRAWKLSKPAVGPIVGLVVAYLIAVIALSALQAGTGSAGGIVDILFNLVIAGIGAVVFVYGAAGTGVVYRQLAA